MFTTLSNKSKSRAEEVIIDKVNAPGAAKITYHGGERKVERNGEWS